MLSLTTKQHDELLRIYRKDPDPELRFRAHILLLLAGGYAWVRTDSASFTFFRQIIAHLVTLGAATASLRL